MFGRGFNLYRIAGKKRESKQKICGNAIRTCK